jgi:hypothetical protein
LRKRQRDLGVQIGAVALETLIVRHVQADVEIAGLAAPGSSLAPTRHAQGRTILDAGGNADLECLLGRRQAAAPAGLTGLAHDGALAAADRARGLDHQEALLVHDLAAPAALLAPLAAAACRRARSRAILARDPTANLDLLGGALGHLGQAQLDAGFQVGPARRRARLAAAEAAEHVAEDVAEGGEDVAHVREAAAKTTAARPIMAEAIVQPALLGVRKHLVGLRGFLEASLGLLVAGIAIRVQFKRELAIGAFQLGHIGVAADT